LTYPSFGFKIFKKPNWSDFFEIQRIKEKYGYSDSITKEFKVFNGEVFSNFKKKIGNKYYFKLEINHNFKKISLVVFDSHGNIVDNSTYWSFTVLEEKLYCKLQYLALITVSYKYYKGQKSNHYCHESYYGNNAPCTKIIHP